MDWVLCHVRVSCHGLGGRAAGEAASACMLLVLLAISTIINTHSIYNTSVGTTIIYTASMLFTTY